MERDNADGRKPPRQGVVVGAGQPNPNLLSVIQKPRGRLYRFRPASGSQIDQTHSSAGSM